MAKTAVFLTADDIDILGHILDNHERQLSERASVMPAFALASALRDVQSIRSALPVSDDEQLMQEFMQEHNGEREYERNQH